MADDPLARQSAVEDKAGGYDGERKYGPTGSRTGSKSKPSSRPRKPQPGEMGPGSERTVPRRDGPVPVRTVDVQGASETKKRRGRPRKTGRPGA